MKFSISIVALLVSLNLAAATLPDEMKLESLIIDKCKSNKPILMLFISNDESKKESVKEDNELYADWSYYLNENAPSISDNLTIIKTSILEGRQLLNSKIHPKDKYSLVFFPCNKKPLYAEEPIIEGYVYKYMKLYLENNEKDLTFSILTGDTLIDPMSERINTPSRLGLEYIDITYK